MMKITNKTTRRWSRILPSVRAVRYSYFRGVVEVSKVVEVVLVAIKGNGGVGSM